MGQNALLRCLFVFFPPVAEIILLHGAVHRQFGGHNTVIGIYSRDVYVPLLVGAVYVFLRLERAEPSALRLRPPALLLNACLLGTTLFYLIGFERVTHWVASAELRTLLLLGLALATLASSGFLFLEPAALLRRARAAGPRAWYGVAALACLVCYPLVLHGAWPYVSHLTARSVGAVLTLVGLPPTKITVGSSFVIWHPRFAASINMGCSGLEGIFFFLFGYSLMRFLDLSPRLGTGPTAAVYGAGVVYMFVLNLVRITLFFLFAILVEARWGGARSRRFIEWAFHENVGWLLYLGGMALFFSVVRRSLPAAWIESSTPRPAPPARA